jgi:hypothetical protein
MLHFLNVGVLYGMLKTHEQDDLMILAVCKKCCNQTLTRLWQVVFIVGKLDPVRSVT